ncbi:MAG: hypothetical protein EBU12_06485 [Microbacteriaceae bacterium]|nr:hypothetical protein [Microbacteriaceae bacterium]
MPNLGIIASSISGNLWAPGKDFDSIATVTPYTTTTTVVFSSIPSTYRHLQLRASAAGSAAANITIRFNGDTGNNYNYHFLEGNGASVSVGGGAGSIQYIVGPVVTNTASSYTGIVMDILDYKDTNKNTTLRSLSGADLNGSSNWLTFNSGVWFNTAAVNSISITVSGATFAANSHWALYGIKG